MLISEGVTSLREAVRAGLGIAVISEWSFERIFVQEGSCACCRTGMRKNFQPMLFIQDIEHYQFVSVHSLILL